MNNKQKVIISLSTVIALAAGIVSGDLLKESINDTPAQIKMSIQERQALYEIINAEIKTAQKPLEVSGVITSEKILDAGYKLITENEENGNKIDTGILDSETYNMLKDYLINKEQATRNKELLEQEYL